MEIVQLADDGEEENRSKECGTPEADTGVVQPAGDIDEATGTTQGDMLEAGGGVVLPAEE